jgi:hypothetical protein
MIEYSKPYLLADHVEWLVAGDNRAEVSKGDIELEASILEGLDPEAVVINPEDTSAPEQRQRGRDRRGTQINDCFDHLEYRARALGDDYLFSVIGDVVRLKKPAGSSDQELVYKFLLACGRSDLNKRLAGTFSELCKLAVQRLFGGKAHVFNMDAGAPDRQIVGTNTKDAARYLASTLGASVLDEMLEDLPGMGDGGADIAAALAFKDGAGGHFAVLGQCAASSSEEYWRDKLHQPSRFKNLYHWTVSPILAGFIPVLYRTASGDWANKVNITTLVFDRLRILNSLDLRQQPLPKRFKKAILSALAFANESTSPKKVSTGKGTGKKSLKKKSRKNFRK